MDEEPVNLSLALRLLLQSLSSISALHFVVAAIFLLSVFLYFILELHILGNFLRGCRGDRVHLTYNPASEIYHRVVSRCRILHGRYLATPWLASPHLQTIFLNFFGNPPSFPYKREICRTADGGTVALDWLFPSDVVGAPTNGSECISKDSTTPIVLVVPGLCSDSFSPYMKHLVFKLAKSGLNVVVGNHRGLGGISITSDCFYNAGWTEDVRAIIKLLHQEYPVAPIYAVGASIGANILVKYLGEDGDVTPVAGAAAVCSPWDLVMGDRFINRKLVQRLYDRAIAFGLKGYAETHVPSLSRMANWEGIKKSCSIRDFDNHATCRITNYETVDAYYRQCSSVSYVKNVSVPLLCISASDDPLCTKEAIPWDECRANKNIVLATTNHGGHLAFFHGLAGKKLWWVEAVEEFFRTLHGTPYMHKPKKGLHPSLESNTDNVPYVNLSKRGMLADVGDKGEPMGDSDGEGISDKEPREQEDVDDIMTKTSMEVTVEEKEMDKEGEVSFPAVKQAGEETTTDVPTKKIQEVVGPMRRSLNWLLRLNSRSIWLLTYVAIVTTWPLLGPAILISLRKKFKGIIPGVLHRR